MVHQLESIAPLEDPSDHRCIDLPPLLAAFGVMMVLPEVLIGHEHWVFLYIESDIGCSCLDDEEGKHRKDVMRGVHQGAVVLDRDGLDGVLGHKGALLEG